MNILFICTHNRCRSILGEAIMRKLFNGDIQVKSAGSAPAGVIHEQTLINLAKHGYETNGLTSNSWNDLGGFIPDICITVCDNAAKETCPLWLGKTIKIHWGLIDPTLSNPALSDPTMGNKTDQQMAKDFDYVIGILEKRINKLSQHDLKGMTEAEIETVFNKIGEIV